MHAALTKKKHVNLIASAVKKVQKLKKRAKNENRKSILAKMKELGIMSPF